MASEDSWAWACSAKKAIFVYDVAGAFDNAMQTPAIQKPAYTDVLQMLMASNPCDPANPFAQTALAAKEPKGKGKGKKKGKGKGKGNLKGKATFKKKGGLKLSAKSKQQIIEALARRKESSVGGVGGSGSSYAGMASRPARGDGGGSDGCGISAGMASRPAGSDGGGSDVAACLAGIYGRAHGGGSDVPAGSDGGGQLAHGNGSGSGSGHRISTDDDDGSAVIEDFQVPFFDMGIPFEVPLKNPLLELSRGKPRGS